MGQRTDHAAKTEQVAIANRRAAVADLYLQGWTQGKIAETFEVDKGQICRDLQAIQAEWRAARVRNFDALRERELQEVDKVELQAWSAFEASKEPAKEREKWSSDKGCGTSIKRIERDGNPKWLEIVLKCVARRCKILGLDAPTKIANTDAAGNDILSPEQARAEYLAIFALLRHRGGEAAIAQGPGGAERPDA